MTRVDLARAGGAPHQADPSQDGTRCRVCGKAGHWALRGTLFVHADGVPGKPLPAAQRPA